MLRKILELELFWSMDMINNNTQDSKLNLKITRRLLELLSMMKTSEHTSGGLTVAPSMSL